MTQTLILLCTLAAMAGLALGYWIGWFWDEAKPYLAIAVSLLAVLLELRHVHQGMQEVFIWCWEADLRREPYLDTEPAS